MDPVSSGSLRRARGPALLPHNAVLLMCLVAAICPDLPSAAADDPLEYRVKAAFLLNFTKFIEWPAAAFGNGESPMAICVVGYNPFGSSLDEIVKDEVVNGRKVAVQYIRQAPPPRSCQVLFSDGAGKESKAISDAEPGVLTVGEGESFIRDGGMIAFVIDNNRVRFEISQTATERAGLKLSSKLLSVAKSVEK
jgi:hypothetical protein